MAIARLKADEAPDRVFEFKVLSSWLGRLRGLLGTDESAAPVALTRCSSIHTFGMAYPIDVAFIGERGEVLSVHRSVGPGRCLSNGQAACVLERPESPEAWVAQGQHLWISAISAGF